MVSEPSLTLKPFYIFCLKPPIEIYKKTLKSEKARISKMGVFFLQKISESH